MRRFDPEPVVAAGASRPARSAVDADLPLTPAGPACPGRVTRTSNGMLV
jgi:hypothetical protein